MNIGAVLVPSFAASAVETVEMVTIVVGVGVARQWRATIAGVIAGFLVLGALIAGLRQALSLIPIGDVRIVIGALLLTFGLQWLRKGIRRWPRRASSAAGRTRSRPGRERGRR